MRATTSGPPNWSATSSASTRRTRRRASLKADALRDPGATAHRTRTGATSTSRPRANSTAPSTTPSRSRSTPPTRSRPCPARRCSRACASGSTPKKAADTRDFHRCGGQRHRRDGGPHHPARRARSYQYRSRGCDGDHLGTETDHRRDRPHDARRGARLRTRIGCRDAPDGHARKRASVLRHVRPPQRGTPSPGRSIAASERAPSRLGRPSTDRLGRDDGE